jgi:hypothetical protein
MPPASAAHGAQMGRAVSAFVPVCIDDASRIAISWPQSATSSTRIPAATPIVIASA